MSVAFCFRICLFVAKLQLLDTHRGDSVEQIRDIDLSTHSRTFFALA